ncbi:MAG: 2-C-methyl-D-erythritol 4-phosphate cytidylyltransferase [Alphaproteobacteria bacterium]
MGTKTDDRGFYMIVVAAGKGTRAGAPIPKQYIEIDGKTILRHTLDALSCLKDLNHICLVVNPQDERHYKNALKGYTLNGKSAEQAVSICAGGKTRQQSVYEGLLRLGEEKRLRDDDVVLVHDGARPFVNSHDIGSLLLVMKERECASLAVKQTDTFRIYIEDKSLFQNVSRENLWALQTPQAFQYGLIKKAHEKAGTDYTYTDDTALMRESGHDVMLVSGSKYNIKITTQEDLVMAQRLLSKTQYETKTRTGIGFDVHAFKDQMDQTGKEKKQIRLCGIDIEHERALKGHSDADVAIHALCDAIYGAIAQGDIGLHFPPDNMDYKDMDSALFLKHAMELLRGKNGNIINIDITIICESPKITPYRDLMRSRLAKIMEIPGNCINIKATTTEKLGFTGRREGIAAQAIVSIALPESN